MRTQGSNVAPLATSDQGPPRLPKSPREHSEDVDTLPELRDKGKDNGDSARAPQPSTAAKTAPLVSSVPSPAPSWQRKRSTLLLYALHPEGARECADLVARLPSPSLVRIVMTLCAYALLLTDVPRTGPSVNHLPYLQFEPNVFAAYGPATLPTHALFRNGTAVANSSADIPAALYKFAPSSYGLRTVRTLLHSSSLTSSWPDCLLSSPQSNYDISCGDSLAGTTTFAMLDSLVEAVAANAASTTSYKTMAQTEEGVAIMARGELSALPQRVRFAARAKARWTGTNSAGTGATAASSSTSFLSRHLLDHKYWLSVWATVFNDLNSTNPGVDLCVDDLDRPLFCEKPWAAALSPSDTESSESTLALWDAVSSRVAELQGQLSAGETLDVTLIETETDPLTRLGGALLLAHKLYSVVVLYRVRECTSLGVCQTLALFDERVEGKVLYTDALEWSSLAAALRIIAQVYVAVRLAFLLVACYLAAVPSFDAEGSSKTAVATIRRTFRVFFAVPSQVVVYGSWLPVLSYTSAHIIDALMLYELEDSDVESGDASFWYMAQWLAVHMRSVWMLALLARIRALIKTSAGAWTPAHGVSGVRGHLLPALALGSVLLVVRGGLGVDDRDARILEANEVEPVPTFMLLRAETLDAWKMNLEGVYSDLLALVLTAIVYVVLVLALRECLRWHRRRWQARQPFNNTPNQTKRDAVPEPLFFARSAVPSAAGALWEPSCLVVSWDDDLLEPLHSLLSGTTGTWTWRSQVEKQESTGDEDADEGEASPASLTADIQGVLMNLVFLSDPWNLAVLKLGRARVHLFHLQEGQLDYKVVHAHAKARVAREYSLALENVELLASFRASDLAWEQLITCK
ncbi:hypothetical protein BBJ28_00011039 [Nothophytophthora sp. Chile5]|nr:hypothetical protein BBJ28_00011039 [Nothophytophthora sp. Chile5]